MSGAEIGMWAACAVNIGTCVLVSVPILLREIRDWRLAHRLLVAIFAYERELRERGVTLPARCALCCQVLPAHVDACPLMEHYAEYSRLVEIITRPTIKYEKGARR